MSSSLFSDREPSTSTSLLGRVADQQTDAWRTFVQIYGALIYQWARRKGLQPADAADATQETLLSVSRDLRHFDHSISGAKFRGWLWTILSRRIADAARKRPDEGLLGSGVLAISDRLPVPDESDPPGDSNLDRSGLFHRALAVFRTRYDEKTWLAFWYTVVEGREPNEVASTLGVSRWAVYKARARILQRLREDFGETDWGSNKNQ